MMTLIAVLALSLQEPPGDDPSRRPAPTAEGDAQLLRQFEERFGALEGKLKEAKDEAERDKITTEMAEVILRRGALKARIARRERSARDPAEAPRPPEPPRRGPEGVPIPEGPPRALENPDQVHAWLKDNEPETYRRVMEAQDGGRRPDVMRMLSEAEPRMRQMNEMKERDPKGWERMREMRRLEGESAGLAERARRAPADERERLAQQLKETLGRLFDLREENRAREVAELKQRVETLEKELSNRKSNKEKIVVQRQRELLGARGEFDW